MSSTSHKSRTQTAHKQQQRSLSKHLALVASMLATCAALLLSIQIQSAYAHSLVDNSIHGPEHNPAGQQTGQNGVHSSGYGRSGTNQMVHYGKVSNGNLNRCQSGWMWFNNKCWVATQSRRDFAHAVEMCRKMHNGTLPTIHSEDENEFLRQNIDLHNSPIWLYARHNHQYNQTKWLDKSPINYTRWDIGQPSDKSSLVCIKTEESWYMKKAEPQNGQTECVSFWEDAKWGTQVGCQVLLPVVCERKLQPVAYSANSMLPTEQPQVSASASHRQHSVLGLILLLVLTAIAANQHESRGLRT